MPKTVNSSGKTVQSIQSALQGVKVLPLKFVSNPGTNSSECENVDQGLSLSAQDISANGCY